MCKNIGYLLGGIVVGGILGILVCDETKKKWQKKMKNKADFLSDCCKDLSCSAHSEEKIELT